jgi:hypothetical protein
VDALTLVGGRENTNLGGGEYRSRDSISTASSIQGSIQVFDFPVILRSDHIPGSIYSHRNDEDEMSKVAEGTSILGRNPFRSIEPGFRTDTSAFDAKGDHRRYQIDLHP